MKYLIRNIINVVLIKFLVLVPLSTRAGENVSENARSRPDVEVIEKLILENTVIGFSWVDQPLNKILLIKNGSDRCAIKYTSFHRGNDARPNTWFRSGDESFDAVAEYIVYSGRKTSLLKLTKRPLYGLGRFGYSPSNDRLHCGKSSLLWVYPTSTIILDDSESNKEETEVCPTSEEDFDVVASTEKNLKCYRYDEKRDFQIIKNIDLRGTTK